MVRSSRPVAAFLVAVVSLAGPTTFAADLWEQPRRGSWVQTESPGPRDVTLVSDPDVPPAIVVAKDASSFVNRAATFLADDIERITGARAAVLHSTPIGRPAILLETAPPGTDDRWEAYRITIADDRITIRGSNPRGTAFGVYELCERLGVDPLYHWSGYTPEKHLPLVVKAVTHEQGPPTFKFRGLFHDDEDILPRPKTNRRNYARNVPRMIGKVPMEWYERFFETALRLRMNIVAPWTRTERYFEVQETASAWGLYYTSHHYDTLLSDPWHFRHGDLAEKRGVRKEWDWYTNRDGLIRFWRGGVEENRSLHCIWPIGMRGMDDYGYKFPEDWTEARKLESFNDAFQVQADLVDEMLGDDREKLMHFTMYTEMLPLYLTGELRVPEGVIIVWPDDNDGRMRALPQDAGTSDRKHGVYYHLAYYTYELTKQTHQVIRNETIEAEFRDIVDAGATEYCKTNVSELREYVLGTRFIADIMWDAEEAFAEPNAAERFLHWWCREYFGAEAAPLAYAAYQAYFDLMPTSESLGYGAYKCRGAIESLRKKFAGEPFDAADVNTLPTLRERLAAHQDLKQKLDRARAQIASAGQKRFFFENLEIAATIDRLPTEAGILLVAAMSTESVEAAYDMCLRALVPWVHLERELFKAERWPFDTWYGTSWVRERNWKLWKPREELLELLRDYDPLSQ